MGSTRLATRLTSGDSDLDALVSEALDRLTTATKRDRVIEGALRRCGRDRMPSDIRDLVEFVSGPLADEASAMLGDDSAAAMVDDVRPLLERVVRIRTSLPPCSSVPPTAGNTLPPQSVPPQSCGAQTLVPPRVGERNSGAPHSTEPPPGEIAVPSSAPRRSASGVMGSEKPSSARRAATMPYMEAAAEGFVLVVDDDLGFLRSFTRLLRLSGYEVVSASDGASALSVCRRGRPHLVVTDLDMPPPDGIALAGAINDLYGEDAPPVVLLTGRPDPPQAAPGIARVISKDCRADDLLASLEVFLLQLAS